MLILGSKSPRRKEILESTGLKFKVVIKDAHTNVTLIEKNNVIIFKNNEEVEVKKYKTDKSVLTARTEGGKTVDFKGDESLIGTFVNVEIVESKTWSLIGRLK